MVLVVWWGCWVGNMWLNRKHLSAGQAGEMARAGGARRLVLTHIWPGSDLSVHRRNGEAAYGDPVTLASPNERYEL